MPERSNATSEPLPNQSVQADEADKTDQHPDAQSTAADDANHHDGASQERPTLLERIANGERQAVTALVERYSGLVWSLARRYLSQQQDCEDAVQDVFTDLWRSANRYDADYRTESVFVAMIARRRIIDRLRANTRPGRDTLPLIDAASEDLTDDPSQCAEAQQIRARMAELKPEEREILDLGIIQGYSHSQISDRLTMPLGTVKSHMRRGLKRLQAWLNVGDDA